MRKNITKAAIIIILLFVAVMCGIFFAREYIAAKKEMGEYERIQNNYTFTEFEILNNETARPQENNAVDPAKHINFDALHRDNPDTVGWVYIPGTPVDYPVVQTSNNETYLNRSFTGEKSSAGSVFMDYGNNAQTLDQNTVLYAHNMGYGRTDMFGSLLKYKDQEYYAAHPYIQFDTVSERQSWWKIFAVVHLDIRDGFDYLKLNFATQHEFSEWISEAKARALYDTGVEVSPNTKVLTLSTCDRSIYDTDGRLLIIAVIIQ